MRVGILYEGIYDKKPLFILIEKIVKSILPEGEEALVFIPKPSHGSIAGEIKAAAELFFGIKDCDLAVFVADTDGDSSLPTKIRASASSHCRSVNSSAKYAFAFPNPELEQWFIDEQDSLKHILSLPKEASIPYPDMSPKERVVKLINERPHQSITESNMNIYEKIAEKIHILKLKGCSPSFKSFCRSLQRAL